MNRLFRNFSAALQRSVRWASRQPLVTLAVTLLALVVAFSQIPRLKVIIAIDDLMDDSFQATRELQALKDSFSSGYTALAIFSPKNGTSFGVDELCAIRRWFSEQSIQNADLSSSFSVFDIRHPELKAGRLLYPQNMLFSCSPDHLAPGAKSSGLETIRTSPWSLMLTDRAGRDLATGFSFREHFDPVALGDLIRSAPPGAIWTGTAIYQHYMFEGLQNTYVLNLLILIILLLMIRAMFGTWRAGGLFIITLLISGVLLHGAMAFAGAPVDILSNSLFLLVAVAALEDFVFISHEQLSRGTSWRRSFRTIATAGFFTSLTTIIGFASLGISPLSIVRRFGVWAAVGATLEWAATFWVLPAVIALFPALRVWTQPSRVWLPPFSGKWVRGSLSRWVVRGSLVVFPLAVLCWPHLNVSDAPSRVFPENHPTRQALARIRENRGWEADISLVFEDASDRQKNQGLLERLGKNPEVVKVESPYEVIDSMTQGLPRPTADLVVREFSQSEAYRRLYSGDGSARAILYIRDSDLKAVNSLRRSVRELCPAHECFLAGNLVAYAEFADQVPKTLLESLVLSLGLVALVIAVLAFAVELPGGGRTLVSLLVSCFWGSFAMLIVLAVFQVQVNFLTCIFASVLVGLTGDNAIQFILGSRKGPLSRGIATRGGGSIQCSLAMTMAGLIFLGSYFYPPRVFGLLLSTGLLAALAGDLWLLNGLLNLFKKPEKT